MTTAIKRIVMRYLLEADLAIKKSNGDFQTNRYELTYLVENISTDKYNNIQLGPNTLDINQNQFRQLNILEIEIDNIFMELDRSLIKSEDFLRRTIYRYDWIRCKINEYGKIVSIDNIKEMMESWSEIKNLLLRDYIDYAHKLINTTDYLNHKTGYHILLSDQLRSFIDQDSLIEYIYNYQDILEQYINTNNIQTVAVQNSFFNYQFIEAEKDKFEASKKVRGHWLIACSIAIIFLLIFVLILKYKNKSQLLKLYDALDNIQVLKHRLEIQQSDINNSNINIETSITSDSISIKTPSPEDLREKLRTELLNLYEANQDYNIPSVIIQSEAYQILRQHISSDKLIKENSKLWSLLEQTILECSPNFKTNLLLLTNGKLTSQDLKMAYLIKCGVLPSQMTALLGRTKGTISSRRESICLKVFDKNMGVKVIDGIIRSL